MTQPYEDGGGTAAIAKKPRKKPQRPMKLRVIFHNDDFTSKEFVVWALMTIFYKNEIDATSIMSEVHTKGKAAAGIYDYQIAETKIHETIEAARKQEFPLKLTGEQVE
jgi:ATP-dependent Clp protease adaptor protein ClpS